MSRHLLSLPDLVIPNGGTESNVLLATGLVGMTTSGDGFRDADGITIFAPDTLPETVTVHVAEAESGGNFNPLQREGADVVVPVGKTATIDAISFKALKLVSLAVAAERRFKVNKSVGV